MEAAQEHIHKIFTLSLNRVKVAMESGKVVRVFLAVAMVVLIAITSSPSAFALPQPKNANNNNNNNKSPAVVSRKLMDAEQLIMGVSGTGTRCNGAFCLDDIMACAPGCGCLVGVCYGNCCRDSAMRAGRINMWHHA
ncbi:hypothetical protein LguiA_026425 [Lonicera macranthoides]